MIELIPLAHTTALTRLQRHVLQAHVCAKLWGQSPDHACPTYPTQPGGSEGGGSALTLEALADPCLPYSAASLHRGKGTPQGEHRAGQSEDCYRRRGGGASDPGKGGGGSKGGSSVRDLDFGHFRVKKR